MADLERFLNAQAAVYDQVVQELSMGRKKGHLMWFIFPQLQGLGRSPNAEHFAICDLDEATAYLEHPVLGARLVECANLVLRFSHLPMEAMFGPVDALKLRSSMTLFRTPKDAPEVFQMVLEQCFDGVVCHFTEESLKVCRT
jgi:uncharacterized protein (DUF1810 family)